MVMPRSPTAIEDTSSFSESGLSESWLMSRHNGVLPGAGSVVVRVPALGIGIIMTINEVDTGASLLDPIIYRVLDDMFGLEPIDWEDRLIIGPMKKLPPAVKTPSDQRPGPSCDTIVGSYYDQAYGYMNISNFDDVEFEVDPEDLLRAFKDIQPDSPKPSFVGLMSNIFSRGLLLTHFDGPIYNGTQIELATSLEGGKKKVVPVLHGAYTAIFVEGMGAGVFGNFWDGDTGREPAEDDVEAEAEVWFAKVH